MYFEITRCLLVNHHGEFANAFYILYVHDTNLWIIPPNVLISWENLKMNWKIRFIFDDFKVSANSWSNTPWWYAGCSIGLCNCVFEFHFNPLVFVMPVTPWIMPVTLNQHNIFRTWNDKIFQPTVNCTSVIKFKTSVRSRTEF